MDGLSQAILVRKKSLPTPPRLIRCSRVLESGGPESRISIDSVRRLLTSILSTRMSSSTKNAISHFSPFFGKSEKWWGWPATGLKARGLALADTTWLWLFSCCLPRATKYHSYERRAFRISRLFCTLSRTLSCNEPCLFFTAACLLPPAATACYICCRRLLCENKAWDRSGLETILGRVLSTQFLGQFGRSLEHEAASFTRGKNPIGVATKGAIEWGDTHACCTLTPEFFLDYYQLPTSVEPLTARLTWRGYAGPHRHAGFIPLPQQIYAVLAIASSTLLGPVFMWICHMSASANSLPCSRVPALDSSTLLGLVSKWIRIIIHACANSHPCSRRL